MSLNRDSSVIFCVLGYIKNITIIFAQNKTVCAKLQVNGMISETVIVKQTDYNTESKVTIGSPHQGHLSTRLARSTQFPSKLLK